MITEEQFYSLKIGDHVYDSQLKQMSVVELPAKEKDAICMVRPLGNLSDECRKIMPEQPLGFHYIGWGILKTHYTIEYTFDDEIHDCISIVKKKIKVKGK